MSIDFHLLEGLSQRERRERESERDRETHRENLFPRWLQQPRQARAKPTSWNCTQGYSGVMQIQEVEPCSAASQDGSAGGCPGSSDQGWRHASFRDLGIQGKFDLLQHNVAPCFPVLTDNLRLFKLVSKKITTGSTLYYLKACSMSIAKLN